MRNEPYFLVYCCICYSVVRKGSTEEDALKVYHLVSRVSSNILTHSKVNLTHVDLCNLYNTGRE